MKAEERRALIQANDRRPLPAFEPLPYPENLLPFTNVCLFCGAGLEWVECGACWAVMGEYTDPTPGRRFIRYPPAAKPSRLWSRYWASLSPEARGAAIAAEETIQRESAELWESYYKPRRRRLPNGNLTYQLESEESEPGPHPLTAQDPGADLHRANETPRNIPT